MHERKHQVILWVLSTLILASGFYLSKIQFMQEEWLSRAGSLIVVLGIWSSLGGIIQERVLVNRLKVRRRLAIARARRKLRRELADADTTDKQIDSISKSFEQKIKAVSDELRLSVGIQEVSLLITGTLIWGFGDLVAHSFFL